MFLQTDMKAQICIYFGKFCLEFVTDRAGAQPVVELDWELQLTSTCSSAKCSAIYEESNLD